LKPETLCDTLDLANGSDTLQKSYQVTEIRENSEERTESMIATETESMKANKTECDTDDLATTRCDNVPAILLSPASNEGTEIEEKILQDEQILNHHRNDEHEENTKDNVQHPMQNDEKRNDFSQEGGSPNVGPIIQVTDCDTEKNNSSGQIAASCIIAR